jgi:diguanylate cyclase (GGDEF)-like protein/PAS domain S-box-containing protein
VDGWQQVADLWYDAALGFVRWDSDARVLEWSPGATAIFGWPFEEVHGKTPLEIGLVAAADAHRFDEVVRQIVERGSHVTENVNRTRDGRVLHCRWFNSVLQHDDGVGYNIVSLVEDVSEMARARSAALESEERFRSLFDWSPDPVFALSRDGIIERANAAAARSAGLDEAQLVGRTVTELIAPIDVRDAQEMLRRAADGRASSLEMTVLGSGGTTYPVLATLIPIVLRSRIAGVHLIARDLSAIRRAERAVATHTDRLRELYVVAAAANATAENQIAATIEAGCRLLGLDSGALYDAEADRCVATVGTTVPRSFGRLALATDGALAIEDLRELPRLDDEEPDGPTPGAYVGTAIEVAGARYGSLCFVSATPRIEPFTDSDRDLIQLMGALVASAIERSRARARLKQLAYNDALTALPNRAWFTERLREELTLARDTASRVAVMFLDLDRFKDINDTLGHALGDRLLRQIGDRLTSVVGAEGLVARMGGDEFIVLVGHDPTTERLDRLAQRIVSAIDQVILIDGYEQYVTTSIGIAVYPDDGDDADALIKHADVAMYRAKERGRNTHQFFTPSLGASLRTRISQEKSLRRALERQEFVVHYQPQLDLVHGRVRSVEALVRWNHPELGLVLPGEFIPSAEMSGLIVSLGDWVLETACRQLRAWEAVAPELRLAVNLSARQFHQSALVAKIGDLLERTGVRPDRLELEITESVAMSDAALSVQILEEIGNTGVRIAVDDFGTGYSSLGYLRRFPLDSLKIDQSFVQDVLIEPGDATIVRTVIAMAHSLGLEVCAEGVETEDQVAFLRQERCDRIQGYYLAQPMEAVAMERYLGARGIRAALG